MAWSKRTRLSITLNVAVTIVFAFVLLVMANIIGKKYYLRRDLTTSQLFRLSDQTRTLLLELNRENAKRRGTKREIRLVQITTFFSQSNPLFERVKDLLEEYQTLTPHLKVEHVDPERDRNRAISVLKALQKETAQLNDVLIMCGENSKNVSERDLAEYDYGGMGMGDEPGLKSFKGEPAITSAIMAVLEDQTSTVYFTQGHGEPDPESGAENGLRTASDLLQRENLRVEKLALTGRTKLPDDCRLLVIAAPDRSFLKEELKMISDYLASGGKLLALINATKEPINLVDFFKDYHVELGQGIVFDPAGRLLLAPLTTFATSEYGVHPIVEKLRGVMTIFNAVRPLKTLSAPKELTVTELVKTSPQGWADNNVEENAKQNKIVKDEGIDEPGPITIMAAVESKSSEPQEEAPDKAPAAKSDEKKSLAATAFRMVIAGDASFANNESMGNPDLFMNAVNWLIQKESRISIRPQQTEERKVSLGPGDMAKIFWFCFLGLPLLSLGAGGMVWMFRRN